MKKKRFSDEQLQRASGIDIAAMLQGQGEKLKKQGRVYRWLRYDSTVIDRNPVGKAAAVRSAAARFSLCSIFTVWILWRR